MNSVQITDAPKGGADTAGALFALTDEQILEIEPEAQDVEVESQADPQQAAAHSANESAPTSTITAAAASANTSPSGGAEAPQWLAEMMADPLSGGEARDFWQGVRQARQESAEYRKVFAKPEDARAAAERSHTLDEFDAAFYSGAGKPPEQATAARAALAQRLLREDPTAFREMVFAGLRAIEEAGAPGETQVGIPANAGLKPGATAQNSASGTVSDAPLTAYRQFEESANEGLERSVGNAIERTVRQALPNLGRSEDATGARDTVPLQHRLAVAIREEIDSALKGDRQLGEQVAQLLASCRFDDATRAQVVRLIDHRAQQLVPTAARRVINSWTQTTLAAHRASGNTSSSSPGQPRNAAGTEANGNASRARTEPLRQTGREERRSATGRLDYRKLSDEQILEL